MQDKCCESSQLKIWIYTQMYLSLEAELLLNVSR